MPHVKEIRKRESLKLRLLVVPSLLSQMFGGVPIVQLPVDFFPLNATSKK
jgi:hypothetical protein